jgi:YhcH/YjgK/YiaL family protein
MKRLLILCACILLTLTAFGQEVYTQAYSKSETKKSVKWSKLGTWRQGFAASPHSSVNLTEFRTQYEKNQAQWDAMFQWLASHDLQALPKGKYPIEGTTLTVSIEDSKNEALEKRRSESHYHHIDFQWVVKGTERFAVLEHNSSKPNCEYRPDVIHYDYDATKAHFYDSDANSFFLFFPCDWHIAKVATEQADQTIRVIVVKLDYVD